MGLKIISIQGLRKYPSAICIRVRMRIGLGYFHNADGSVGSMDSNFNILPTDPYTYKNKVLTDCARIIIMLGRIYGCQFSVPKMPCMPTSVSCILVVFTQTCYKFFGCAVTKKTNFFLEFCGFCHADVMLFKWSWYYRKLQNNRKRKTRITLLTLAVKLGVIKSPPWTNSSYEITDI